MPYQQTSRAQLRVLVRERLGNAANTFWRDDELNIAVINPALRLFNLLTGFWKTRTTITTVANQVWYALPSAITSNLRVTWQGYPLSPATFYDMDFGRAAWQSETTTSGGDVPSRPTLYVIGALNLLAIWPADAPGNSQLVVDGIAATPFLATDAQLLDLGQEELKGLLNCCQMLAVFKEGGKEFADSVEVFKAFLKSAGERNSILRASATYRSFLGLDRARAQKPYKLSDDKVGAR